LREPPRAVVLLEGPEAYRPFGEFERVRQQRRADPAAGEAGSEEELREPGVSVLEMRRDETGEPTVGLGDGDVLVRDQVRSHP
jgi:hypothetical protein